MSLGWLVALACSVAAAAEPEMPPWQALAIEAGEHHVAGRLEPAEELLRRAVDESRTALGSEHDQVAILLFRLADVERRQGEYDAAVALLEEVINIREGLFGPADPRVAEALDFQAGVLKELGHYDDSLALYERVLKIRDATQGPRSLAVAQTLNNLGSLVEARGEYPRAQSLYERCLAILQGSEDAPAMYVAWGKNNLAGVLQIRGEHTAARALMEEALATMEEAGDLGAVATLLNNMASAARDSGDYANSESLFRKSLEMLLALHGPDHPLVASSKSNLADVVFNRGDPALARHLKEDSLRIREATLGPDHPLVGQSLHGLASLLKDHGDFDAAWPLYIRALRIQEAALGDRHPQVAQSLIGLAVIEDLRGHPQNARELLEKALEIRKAAYGEDHFAVANALSSLSRSVAKGGDIEAGLGMQLDALTIAEGALGLDHPHLAPLLSAATRLLSDLERYEAALPHIERALAIREAHLGADHQLTAQTRDNVAGILFALGREDEARPLRLQSLAEVTAFAETLLPSLSEREAIEFIAQRRYILDRTLGTFDRDEDALAVWDATLRWKGAVARTLARRTALADDDPQIADKLTTLNFTRLALARVALSPSEGGPVDRRAKLAQLTRDKERLERELTDSRPDLRARLGEKTVGAKEVCERIPPDTALVDFLRHGGEFTAFIIVDCEVHRVDLGSADEIAELVSSHREALANQVSGDAFDSRINRRGARLAEAIWDPIAPWIEASQRILLVPDAEIAAVSFAALPVGRARFLIEDFELSYLESAADIVQWSDPPAGTEALVVGDLDFGPSDAEPLPCVEAGYGPLPGTRKETVNVAQSWITKRGPATVLGAERGDEASVVAAMPGKRLIHLATHGFFADHSCRSALGVEGSGIGFDPMFLSGVVLSGVNAGADPMGPWDGILTAAEVSGLDLRETQLVVLSACETGLGIERAGEGVMGLRRGFAAAGARTVVMTLWSIPDEASAKLMKSFYGHFLRRNARPAPDALRRAQLQMLQKNRNTLGEGRPASWAAFVSAGDWR